ncbi:hypothetical protein QF015_000385 [Paenarthrobacter sp. TE4293]
MGVIGQIMARRAGSPRADELRRRSPKSLGVPARLAAFNGTALKGTTAVGSVAGCHPSGSSTLLFPCQVSQFPFQRHPLGSVRAQIQGLGESSLRRSEAAQPAEEFPADRGQEA